MKLKFDANLKYQQQAVASIVDLFRGQTPMQANFTVYAYGVNKRVKRIAEIIMHSIPYKWY